SALGAAEIHEAAATGNTASVAALLASDSRLVRAKTATLLTPLHYAAVRGHAEVARQLIGAGADPDARTEDGRTPLQFAFENPEMSERDRTALVDLLASGPDIINSIDGIGLSPLHYAARFGNASAASLLIARGALVAARDAKGNTPLHLAAEAPETGAAEVALVLMNAGAPVNAVNFVNVTPLHAAVLADKQQEELVRLLVKYGASLTAKDSLGQTPWRAAVSSGNMAMASLLNELGASGEPQTATPSLPASPTQHLEPPVQPGGK
ncbi:MAG TPA: ankyrin repeat domain-containing protein, partial [Candidatus Ozemobacteraceae bacterium]|nr:ankyrin repeat domain-containing protein [Candidatus Ozemobacteraceae bacterium]